MIVELRLLHDSTDQHHPHSLMVYHEIQEWSNNNNSSTVIIQLESLNKQTTIHDDHVIYAQAIYQPKLHDSSNASSQTKKDLPIVHVTQHFLNTFFHMDENHTTPIHLLHNHHHHKQEEELLLVASVVPHHALPTLETIVLQQQQQLDDDDDHHQITTNTNNFDWITIETIQKQYSSFCYRDQTLVLQKQKNVDSTTQQYHFKCIESKPFTSGIIDVNKTKVILLLDNNESTNNTSHHYAKKKKQAMESLSNEDDSEDDELPPMLQVSKFYHSSRNQQNQKTATTTTTSRNFNLLIDFESYFVTHQQHFHQKRSARNVAMMDSSIDPDLIGFVSTKLLKKYHVLNGSWVELYSEEASDESHLVQLFAVDDDDSNNNNTKETIILSPILAFNVLKSVLNVDRVHVRIQPFADAQPTVANVVVLAPISSPNQFSPQQNDPEYLEMMNQLGDISLKQYFKSKKRVVKEGDVIAVPSALSPEIITELTNASQSHGIDEILLEEELACSSQTLDHVHQPFCYYRVMEIRNESYNRDATRSYLLHPTYTRLNSNARPVQGFLPPIIDSSSLNVHLLPPYQALAKQFIEPILSLYAQRNLKTQSRGQWQHLSHSMLIHGERGTGKRHAVHALASTYGLHCIELNCYELLSENDAQTNDSMKQVFTLARQVSPCILYLRNMDAFDAESAGGAAHLPASMKSAKLRLVQIINEQLKNQQRLISRSSNGSQLYPILCICSVEKFEDLTAPFRTLFMNRVNFPLSYNIEVREKLAQTYVDKASYLSRDVSAHGVASHFTGASVQDIRTALSISQLAIIEEEKDHGHRSSRSLIGHRVLSSEPHIGVGVKWFRDKMKISSAAAGGASTQVSSIPQVKWQDIGGLENAKQEILDTIQQSPLFAKVSGKKSKGRCGVLLYGPPGTGKVCMNSIFFVFVHSHSCTNSHPTHIHAYN